MCLKMWCILVQIEIKENDKILYSAEGKHISFLLYIIETYFNYCIKFTPTITIILYF